MRPMFFRKALASLLLLTACLASRAGEPPGLIVDFDASNPPLMYAGKPGAAGLYPLLVAKACERAGIAVTLRAVSWRMALQELRGGSAAAGGIIKTASREKLFDFSQPLFTERVVMAYPRAGGQAYRRLEDLNGKRVGVMAGWSYGDAFDQARKDGKFAAFDGDSDQQNLQQLKLGRLDVVLGIREPLQLALREGGHHGFALSAEALSANHSYLAINKHSQQQALLTRFDLALEGMRKDGSYDKLVRDFLSARGGD
ncbi:ABC transporter substrate-binding protein [Chromobacterium vaccinii]|uniref:substrate-binding periplasmic protein n=1 Tax=Chromobacterium vaccinii TaxID=1108595 RepID=UPI000CE98C5D|nr:transporter substrate-binding domain-containing protein [Chromobacterium vaccinii]AVG15239.1 ABC transporter substrate-binding protein [Chromobacterium vaccinii]